VAELAQREAAQLVQSSSSRRRCGSSPSTLATPTSRPRSAAVGAAAPPYTMTGSPGASERKWRIRLPV